MKDKEIKEIRGIYNRLRVIERKLGIKKRDSFASPGTLEGISIELDNVSLVLEERVHRFESEKRERDQKEVYLKRKIERYENIYGPLPDPKKPYKDTR